MNQVAIIGVSTVLAAVWSAALTTWMFWLKQDRSERAIHRNSAPVRTIPLSESMRWARTHPQGTFRAKMGRGSAALYVDHPHPQGTFRANMGRGSAALPLSRLGARSDLAAEDFWFPREPSYSSTWPDEAKPRECASWRPGSARGCSG